jgi:hypothetical protein
MNTKLYIKIGICILALIIIICLTYLYVINPKPNNFRTKEKFDNLSLVKSITISNPLQYIGVFGVFVYDQNGNAINLSDPTIGTSTQTSTYADNISTNPLKIIKDHILNTSRTLTIASNNNNYPYGLVEYPPSFMDWDNNTYCAHTQQDGVWIYNFNNLTTISGIEVFSRKDCCVARINNLQVNVFNTNVNVSTNQISLTASNLLENYGENRIANFSFGTITNASGAINDADPPANINDARKLFTIINPTTTMALTSTAMAMPSTTMAPTTTMMSMSTMRPTTTMMSMPTMGPTIAGTSVRFTPQTGQPVNIAGVFIYGSDGKNIITQDTGATMNSTYSTAVASNALKITLENKNKSITDAPINFEQGWSGPDGYIAHSAAGIGDYWQYNFASPVNISGVEIYPRTDCCQDRNTGLIVSILDSNGTVVWTSLPAAYSEPSIIVTVQSQPITTMAPTTTMMWMPTMMPTTTMAMPSTIMASTTTAANINSQISITINSKNELPSNLQYITDIGYSNLYQGLVNLQGNGLNDYIRYAGPDNVTLYTALYGDDTEYSVNEVVVDANRSPYNNGSSMPNYSLYNPNNNRTINLNSSYAVNVYNRLNGTNYTFSRNPVIITPLPTSTAMAMPSTTMAPTTTMMPTTSAGITSTTVGATIPTTTSAGITSTTVGATVPTLSPSQTIALLNSGVDMSVLTSEGISMSSAMRGPSTNIVQTNFSGTSNIYSPYLFYNKNLSEQFTGLTTDTDKNYYNY